MNKPCLLKTSASPLRVWLLSLRKNLVCSSLYIINWAGEAHCYLNDKVKELTELIMYLLGVETSRQTKVRNRDTVKEVCLASSRKMGETRGWSNVGHRNKVS